jgi:phospholipid/cholesterol/gamma-HCH transport system substrate-binding protein
VAVQTQRQVFGVGGQPGQPGQAGLVGDSRATILQLQGLLTDARATLTRVDGVLAEAQGIAANTRSATTDLGTLRTEVEASLRRVQQLADELNRRWPFARDNEVKLP